MLAADRVTPWVTMAGTVMPIGPSPSCSAKWSTICLTTAATACGVAGCGVGMRSRSVANSPFLRSTMAPLMPDPPMSMPSANFFMREA